MQLKGVPEQSTVVLVDENNFEKGRIEPARANPVCCKNCFRVVSIGGKFGLGKQLVL
jgi:hypothetical protein